jgi:hypothetical protein
MDATPQISPSTIPALLKLTLVPPAAVVVGLGTFFLAWDSESEFMLFIGMVLMMLGGFAAIPALLVAAVYSARRLTRLSVPEFLTISLAVVGNGGVLFAAAKAFEWI